METDRRLHRSSDNRMIAGVAAGFADHFSIDVTIARIIFGILLFTGVGLPLYLLCWLVMPREESLLIGFDAPEPRRSVGRTILQILGLVIMVAIINDQIGHQFALVAFVVGAAVGGYFLLRSRDASDEIGHDSGGTLYRSDSNRKLLGVFAGLAEILRVDVTILRVVGVILLVVAFPVTAFGYLLYAFLVPVRRVIIL